MSAEAPCSTEAQPIQVWVEAKGTQEEGHVGRGCCRRTQPIQVWWKPKGHKKKAIEKLLFSDNLSDNGRDGNRDKNGNPSI